MYTKRRKESENFQTPMSPSDRLYDDGDYNPTIDHHSKQDPKITNKIATRNNKYIEIEAILNSDYTLDDVESALTDFATSNNLKLGKDYSFELLSDNCLKIEFNNPVDAYNFLKQVSESGMVNVKKEDLELLEQEAKNFSRGAHQLSPNVSAAKLAQSYAVNQHTQNTPEVDNDNVYSNNSLDL